MSKWTLIILAIFAPFAAHAKSHTISVEHFSYPSPAVTHLSGLQAELGQKAIEVCGKKELVEGLDNISIHIISGTDHTLAVLSEKGTSLDLWYPKMVATAILTCRD